MADTKISALPAATTPLAGTEVLPIVQGGTTDKVSVANLTAGRTVATGNLNVTGEQTITGAVRALLKMYGDFAGGTDVGKIQFFNAVDEFLAQISIQNTTGAAGDTSNMELWVSAAGVAKKVITLESDQDVALAAGNLVPSTAAKGVNFTANTPAAGMTSQLLNWYEEGTWTPTFGGSTTYYGRAGTYTRVGRLVFVEGYIHIDTNGTGSQTTISGLPFTPASSRDGIVFAYNTGLATNIVSLAGRVETGSTIVMYSRTAAATASAANNLCANGAYFEFSGCYYV